MGTKGYQTIWIILFFGAGCAIVAICPDSLLAIATLMAMAGAFGGLLYTMRDSGLELIHWDTTEGKTNNIRLGWLADCAYGLAGAFVVFLIIPTDLDKELLEKSLFDKTNTLELIKFLSLALVGGYGGRSLVDRALANVAKDAEEAKAQSNQARQEVKDVKENIEKMKELDATALEAVINHLDDEGNDVDTTELKESIVKSSGMARYEILKDTRKARMEGYKGQDADMILKTIPIFEALIESDTEAKYHRNHGQLGYALWDSGLLTNSNESLEKAYKQLSTAIKLRDELGAKGFLYYEFVRGMCSITLNGNPEEIIADIKHAATRPSLHKKIQEEPIYQKWAKKNDFDLVALMKTN